MTLQQFEYIVALEKFRHFTKAAEYCNVTQPTLSAMIQKLEDELEVKIFDRSQQPIAPTAAGQLVIKQAKEVLVQAEQIKNIVQEQKQEVCGKFTLGVLPTIAPYLLPRFISNFTQKYPKLELRIAELKTHEIKRALLSGDIDAGILADIEDLEEYNISHLFYEQYMAYVSNSCPLYEKSENALEQFTPSLDFIGRNNFTELFDLFSKNKNLFRCFLSLEYNTGQRELFMQNPQEWLKENDFIFEQNIISQLTLLYM